MATEASSPRRKLSAIVMVDVSGFSRMMSRDEEGTTARIREFHSRVRSIVEAHEGRVVDTAGDSAFGEFDSVVNAVRCAQAIQNTQAADNAGRPPEEKIETRIGVHLGDVIVQDYQVYGDGVNIAARLQSLADPGGVCVSEAVYQQVFQKLGLSFEDLGVQKLKNIEYPIRLYRMVLGEGDNRPKEPAEKLLQTPGPIQQVHTTASWTEAFLTRGGLIPLVLGLFLLTAPLGLFPFPQRGIAPTAGTVLIGVGFGHIWARRTGRRGHFLVALGAGIALGAAFLRWSGLPNWPFVIAGLIIVLRGLRDIYTVASPSSGSNARQARRDARHAQRDARRAARRPPRQT
jgi:class 3 adenylate cyclase